MNNNIFFFFYDLSHQSKVFDGVVYFFAEIFPYIIVLMSIFYLFFHHEKLFANRPFKEFSRKLKECTLVFFSAVLAWSASHVLKLLFHVERPFVVFHSVKPLFIESGYAFPSGHSTFFMALAFALFLIHKRTGIFFITSAFMIGVARIISGVHYPFDIFGGLVLGILIAYLARFLYNLLNNHA